MKYSNQFGSYEDSSTPNLDNAQWTYTTGYYTCGKCGAWLEWGWSFCPYCGYPVMYTTIPNIDKVLEKLEEIKKLITGDP